jgi:diadenosine tetraphosphatase ApaH/serine/threonine PP2A family protein phosphatase
VPFFGDLDVPLVVCGHTHMQFDRAVDATRVVNAGSVGMPFGEAGAYWLLLEPDVVFRRTVYDLSEAATRIQSTSYPQAKDFAQRNVVEPLPECDMLAFYSRIELQV